MRELSKVASTMMRVAEAFYLMPRNPWIWPKPGQAYASLDEETKKLLMELKSDDVKDIRPYA